MALRTVSNTGGNWNATTSWVGGVVPIAGDTVDFTPTSGNLIVNVATAVLAGVDFTNYVNTITFNNIIQLNTNLNLGTGGYTQAGTSGLSINANTTISGTTVWTRGFLIGANAAVTLTLSNNLNITDLSLNGNLASLSFILGGNILSISNNISFIGAGTYTLNIPQDLQITNLLIGDGGNRTCTINGLFTLSISGNLTENHGVSTVSGTTSIVLNGTGTWSNVGTGVLQNNLTINSPSGTITISGTVYYNTKILTYTAGTVDTTTNNSTLNIGTSTTLDTDRGVTKIIWNNITITAGTTTLSSNLTVGGTLSLTGTINGAFTITTVNLSTGISVNNTTSTSVTGNLTINGTTSGASTIILNGIGNQTWSHGSAVYLSNSLTINKSSGVLSIGTNVYYNTGTLTYNISGGTVTTTSSTLNIGGSTTLNTNGISWNNFTCNVASTITLNSDLVWGGTMTLVNTVAATLSFSGIGLLLPTPSVVMIIGQSNYVTNAGNTIVNFPLSSVFNITSLTTLCGGASGLGYNCTMNNVTFNLSGNLTVSWSNQGFSSILGTSSSISMIGSGTIAFTLLAGNGGTIMSIQFTINTSGTYNFSGTPYFSSTVNYLLGTILGATCIFTGASLNLNPGGKWGTDVILQGSITLLSNSTFGNTSTSTSGSLTLSGSFVMNVEGNLSINIPTSGVVPIIINGTGDQTWSHNSSGVLSNNLTINKPSGTLTIGTSFNIRYLTGTLTYTAGTVVTTGSTLNIGGSATLDTDRGATKIIWTNFTCDVTSTITLNSNFTCTGVVSLASSVAASVTFSGIGLLLFMSSVTMIIGQNNYATNAGNTVINFPPSSVFNIVSLTARTGGASNVGYNCTINNATFNLSGNLSVSWYNQGTPTINGTNSLINMIGTGTINGSGTNAVVQLSIPITINTTGTITFSGTINISNTTITYTSGTLTGVTVVMNTCILNLNAGGVWAPPVALVGNTTLLSNANFTNLTTQTSSVVLSGLFNVTVAGNLAINITTSGIPSITLNGTGNQTWSHGSAVYLSNNLTINKLLGTLTIGTNVYYNTNTLTYTAGTVDTTTNNSTLNINASTTLYSNGLSWNNLTISGNTTLTLPTDLIFIGTCSMVGSGTTTITLAGVGIINAILGTLQLTVSGGNLTLTTSATHNILNYQFNAGGFAINGSGTWNVYGNLIRNGAGNGRSATGTINFLGSGSILFNGGSTGAFVGVWNINPSGTLTFGSVTFPNVYYEQSTITYIGGTVDASNCNLLIGFTITNQTTTLNTSPINWKNITLSGTNTLLLTSNLNLTGNLTTQTGGITINGLFNVNVGGNLTINIGTSGTSIIILNGTGNQTWSHGSAVYLSNSLTINKSSGTLTIGTNVYYNTGTLSYIIGIVDIVDTTTNSSTLNINSPCTLNLNPIVWYNLNTSFSGTITLSSNLTWSNLWSVTAGSPVFSGVAIFTPTPTSRISFTGTAAVTTPGSILSYTFLSITISTSGTTTLTGDLLCSGLLTLGTTTSTTTINGSGGTRTITTGGGITLSGTTAIILGTTNIKVTGGTITGTSTVQIRNNIDLDGNITFTNGVSFYYNTGILSYTSGIITTIGSVLVIGTSTTLNTDGVSWDNIITNGISTSFTLTLTSGGNLIVNNLSSYYNINFIMNSNGILYVNNNLSLNIPTASITSGLFGTMTFTLPNNLIVNNLTLYYNVMPNAYAGYGVTLNNFGLTVNGNITIYHVSGYGTSLITFPVFGGTTQVTWKPSNPKIIDVSQAESPVHYIDFPLILNGVEFTLPSKVIFRGNVTINSNITTKFNGTLNYTTNILRCNYGNVDAKNCNLFLLGNSTLININKINFNGVTITSGVNITMNEFFSGSPSKKTTISPSSTTNYTITFQDGFEKFTKFIKLSRATISRPNQLTVITDKGNQGNNVGVKFAPNQLANGLPKNTPSTSTVTPYGLQPSYLVTDPTLS